MAIERKKVSVGEVEELLLVSRKTDPWEGEALLARRWGFHGTMARFSPKRNTSLFTMSHLLPLKPFSQVSAGALYGHDGGIMKAQRVQHCEGGNHDDHIQRHMALVKGEND
ncbi:unnamed protein product [Natator depressus]